MALPSSGSISFDDIKAELGISGELGLTDSRVRTLAGKASGEITLPNDLWGKANFNAYAVPSSIYASGRAVNSGAIRPGTAQGNTSIAATPSDGVTYAWSQQNGSGHSVVLTASNATATIRYSSTFYSSAIGTLTCVVSRGSASVTVIIPYELHIDADQIGDDL